MSTFDGVVREFPDIRIDYFRTHPEKPHPSACFLSHVHSDHLMGLETLKMPFVYCSATTRRILLRMEKYSHRINFSKGILEARKQTYKHLKFILRPLPLQTPTELELGPKSCIRVTLLDANHCPGAVMFLIQGDGKAVLYTGDIRAESWWVNSIARNPFLLPFTTGVKLLDCLYLDTTFASHSDIHRSFPTKADGLTELSAKVRECPDNSIFYFRAWTLGYEDVWLTLSSVLDSKVHVDPYQLRLFQDHTGAVLNSDSTAALGGFQLGNDVCHGCLSVEQDVRIHSCEPGLPCHLALSKNKHLVWVTPIISRMQDGTEVAEIGAGGGGGDLYQNREAELGNTSVLEGLRLLAQQVSSSASAMEKIEQTLRDGGREKDCHTALNELVQTIGSNMSVDEFVKALVSTTQFSTGRQVAPRDADAAMTGQQRTIHFPFSRHSSYSELRSLVQLLKPRDICPCVVDVQSWTEECSVEALFGDLCASTEFYYDTVVREQVRAVRRDEQTQNQDTQMTDITETQSIPEALVSAEDVEDNKMSSQSGHNRTLKAARGDDEQVSVREDDEGAAAVEPRSLKEAWDLAKTNKRCRQEILTIADQDHTIERDLLCDIPDLTFEVSSDTHSARSPVCYKRRREAFEAAVQCLEQGTTTEWQTLLVTSIGQLGHTQPEREL